MRRTRTKATDSAIIAIESERSARSDGASKKSRSIGRTVPSAKRISPSTDVTRRRIMRTGFDRLRCAAESSAAAPASTTADHVIVEVWAYAEVRTGNAPQDTAKPKSVW